MNLTEVQSGVQKRYVGCFKEKDGDLEFNARRQRLSALTVEACVLHCLPFQYAAVRDGCVIKHTLSADN